MQPHYNLGIVLLAEGHNAEAIERFEQALRINPQQPEARLQLLPLFIRAGRTREAIEHAKQAVRLVPNHAQLHCLAAWLIATNKPTDPGDPDLAVTLAGRACELTGRKDPRCLDTLGAACAAAGHFDEAVTAANEARRVAETTGQDALAQQIHMRLQLYRDHKPFREPVAAPAARRP